MLDEVKIFTLLAWDAMSFLKLCTWDIGSIHLVGGNGAVVVSFPDGDLDVVFTSPSKCGKDKTKSVSSTIFFHCDPLVEEGIPEFSHETADCQYLFSWYTAAVCPLR